MEVLALARYRAQTEDELSLAPGDVVRQVCAGAARGWLLGDLRGRRGLFPKNLVQEIPEALWGVTEPRPRCARRRGHPVNSQDPQRWCKVNFNYSPEQTDELKLQTGEIVEVIKEIEDGWWLGKKNGQLGAFPSNFVELLDSGSPSLGNMPSVPNPPKPPKLSNLTYDSPPDYLRTVSCPETCRVLFDYHPEAPDELALHKGDLVKVLRKTTEDKGWWEGECQGRRGVFPDNFVLPPPPIRKLIPRKIISRDISASVKESKKLMPKTSLPSVKRPATTSAPSKAKTSSTASGDSQKRPSRDSGFNGSFLSGGPRQPGRKQTRTQAPQQNSVLSQENEQRSPGKAPSTNKTPTPEKTPLLDKTLGPAKISAPDKVSTAEVPVPENALDSDKVPTMDKAVTTESALAVDQAPALVAPTKDETVDPKMALHVDSTPALEKIFTPENIVRDNTQCQHLPQEETTQASKSLASPNDIEVPREYPQQSNSSESRCCCNMKHGDSSPAQSRAKDEATMEEATLLEGLPAKDETTLKEPLPKEKLPSEEGVGPQKQFLEGLPAKDETTLKEPLPKEKLPSEEGVGPQKQVPPKEPVPTPQLPHSNKQIPNPEEAPTLHPEVPLKSSKSKNDSVDVAMLKEEVGLLKSALELLELKLEQKMSDVWEELKTEKENLQSLEVRLTQRTQKSFKHAQTQTETQTE